MSSFIPRTVFEIGNSIPKTYFLGHHKAGLSQMRNMVQDVDLVLECRDFRVPAVSINPVFEEALGAKRRYIIYTKRDKGGNLKLENQRKEKLIERWNKDCPVYFMSKMNRISCMPLVKKLRLEPRAPSGAKIMVVGMPNVGKSTLINSLRGAALKVGAKAAKAKAAKVGDQPGVTRSIGGPIKILDGGNKGNIYVYDTPGVFVPYMPDAESMLKLALCNIVRRDLIPITILADYLLFHFNKWNPRKYADYVKKPTNDIHEFLGDFALHSGCLAKGGLPDREAAAIKFIQWWEEGKFGGFIFDDPVSFTADHNKKMIEKYGGSLNEAWKKKKAADQALRREQLLEEKERWETARASTNLLG
ncbi:Mitochondrial GTPase [Ascosphaera aggregata]|nr:Mitochondrial GTPase [Ascosphaera aggregata]